MILYLLESQTTLSDAGYGTNINTVTAALRISEIPVLVDSGGPAERKPEAPREEIITPTFTRFFIVQAASPKETRYEDWMRQNDGVARYMELWTWEELAAVGYVGMFQIFFNRSPKAM